ncbi:MAG: asparagine synthase (glutamine-hydrolyzing) [Candidatus Muiribacterium halophilum]|uniref:asparagine synthase (glutamine-hydrolyzing) n=1 Tax=Muiribacterium halophilum TaxID=2053465 RepID=A0A2N5ZA62_MUIH1|nr:MAG: asparagine synthase (glutamine-hydrolyzing) [Candidatus Muirbacterium halophilum]
MCGISGFSGFENNKELALKANKIQFHRGPDYQGLWNDEYISLSHQRLSIIDLSESANQPFEKREHIIVYNGELYNFHEIRKELRDKGVSFISNSDTEVVLESFLLFGEKCLDKFRGMFSFVIYNKNNGRLFGARDHFGIKPFFYYQGNDNRFAFASELKTIVKQKEIKKDLTLNMAALLSSVNYLWVPENYSMFKEIKKLPSGCFFTKEKFCPMSIKKYYQVSRKKIDLNESEIIEKFKHIFENSIKKHLVSDVEVCSFLSGGLDSSLISVMAQKYYGEKMKTFTIGTRKEDKKIEKMPDDEKYADQLIKKFGFDSEKIVISPKITDELPKAVAFLDEPIGDPAAINTYLICKQAREMGIKVLLSGMGADEILGGYRRHLATIYSQKYKKNTWFYKKTID